MHSVHEAQQYPFLAGGGVSGQLARSVAWERTPIGPPDRWPHSLRTIVSVILQSRHPMFLWWGPQLVQIYNDAYLPSFGRGKHPAAMGQAGRDCWQEIWPIIGPQIEHVMTRGGSTWNEDHLVPIFRNGRIEEVYWTYGYSPVLNDEGGVGGVLVVCTETTSRVIADRRSRTLRALVEITALSMDTHEMLELAMGVLRDAAADIPFAVIYRRDRRTGALTLTHSVGLDDTPAVNALVQARIEHVLPLAGAQPRLIPCDPPLAAGPWPEPCPALFVSPLDASDSQGTGGVMVFGLSARLSFDETYRNHLDQIASHLGLARARINAFRIRSVADSERNNLLLQAPVATALLTGPHHVFQLANPLFCEMVGKSDLVGKAYTEAFPELKSTPLPGILDRVYRQGQPYYTQERLIPLDRRGDGTVEDCYFKFNLEPLRDPTGDVYGMMAVAVDITELVRARQTLERSHGDRDKLLRDLEAASRAKDEFLAMLGHELRNPLSPIATALQLMRLKGEGDTTREQHVIERQVNHLTRLVDDLLDVSRITRGKVELRKELVDMSGVITKAVEMASDLFEHRSHSLSIEIAREPLRVDGNPVRLAQVVANLLTNAARYTDAGGTVRIIARREGESVVVRVKDNGVGITADLLPRLFDLFVQGGERGPDRAQGGLGIGLTLVKSLVTLHGGSVKAMSAGPGQGSEFVVAVPAAPEAADPTPRPTTLPQRIRHSGGRRVLVVDDNIDAADLLGDFLRSEGHEVNVAYSAVSALAAVDTFRPEVAVLDIGLPVMDGYELAAQLRTHEATARCRFIALTGYGQAHDRARSEAAGFDHHLVKPVEIEQLTRLMDG